MSEARAKDTRRLETEVATLRGREKRSLDLVRWRLQGLKEAVAPRWDSKIAELEHEVSELSQGLVGSTPLEAVLSIVMDELQLAVLRSPKGGVVAQNDTASREIDTQVIQVTPTASRTPTRTPSKSPIAERPCPNRRLGSPSAKNPALSLKTDIWERTGVSQEGAEVGMNKVRKSIQDALQGELKDTVPMRDQMAK